MYFPFVKRSFAPSSPTVVSFSLSPKFPTRPSEMKAAVFMVGLHVRFKETVASGNLN